MWNWWMATFHHQMALDHSPKKETPSRRNNRNQQQSQHLYFNNEKTEIGKVSTTCLSYTSTKRKTQVFPKVLFRHALEGLGNQACLSLTSLCWHGIVSWSVSHEFDSGSVREIVFSPTTKGPYYCTTYFIEWACLGLLQVVMRTENPSPLPCW